MSGPSPSIWVPNDVFRKAEGLIKKRDGNSLREGVELILQSDLGDQKGPSAVDAGSLLHGGLRQLVESPFEALSIPLGSQTIDVRKAYKKMALKYHPDKNPKTTPLFQAIKTACDKLENTDERTKEAKKAQSAPKTTASSSSSRPAPASSSSSSSSKAPAEPTSAKTKPTTSSKAHPSKSDEAPAGKPKTQPSQPSQQQQGFFNDVKKEDAARRAAEMRDRRFTEMRAKAEEEARMREQAAKHRDDILRGGRNNYNYQQYSFKGGPGGAGAGSGAGAPSQSHSHSNSNGPQPTPTPDNHKGGSYDYFRPQPNNGNVPNNNNVPNSSSNHNARASLDPLNSNHQSSHSSSQSSSTTSSTSSVHRPYALRYSSVGQTAVELEWKKSIHTTAKTSTELNWRIKGALLYLWEGPKQLIAGESCRKNNLQPGTTYEFRVRAVTELSGGMLGPRSDWSDTLIVKTIPQQPQAQSQPQQPMPPTNNDEQSSNINNSSNNKDKDKPRTSRPTAGGIRTDYNNSNTKKSSPVEKKVNYMERQHPTTSAAPRPRRNNGNDDSYVEELTSDSDTEEGPWRRNKSDKVSGAVHPEPQYNSNNNAKQCPNNNTNHSDSNSNSNSNKDNPLSRTRSAWEADDMMGGMGVGNNYNNFHNYGGNNASHTPESGIEADEIVSDDGSSSSDERGGNGGYKNFTEFYDKKKAGAHVRNVGQINNSNSNTNGNSHIDGNSDANKKVPTASSAGNKTSANANAKANNIDSDNDGWFHLLAPPPALLQRKILSTGRNFQVVDSGLYQHPVHEEPLTSSPIVGSVASGGLAVQMRQKIGNWAKVKFHKQHVDKLKPSLKAKSGRASDWGWCQISEEGHLYLVPVDTFEEEESVEEDIDGTSERVESSGGGQDDHREPRKSTSAGFSGDAGRQPAAVWYERFDDKGNAYYVNSETGESQWEAPEWVEEFDEKTGASYYVHLDQYSANPLHSTWSRPEAFAKLVRAAGAAAEASDYRIDEDEEEDEEEEVVEEEEEQEVPLTARSEAGYYDDFEVEEDEGDGATEEISTARSR